MPALISKQVIALLEDTTSAACVYFRGCLTRDLLLQGQQWLADAAEEYGAGRMRGAILDFRRVESFKWFASSAFRLSSLPQALLVLPYQTQFVARSGGEHAHRRVVTTRSEALDFITAWHAQKQSILTFVPVEIEQSQPLSIYAVARGL